MIKIKEWMVTDTGIENPYLAPEQKRKIICGAVYGHPKFKDGERIITSPIKKMDFATKKIQTNNTEYILDGAPDKDWGDWVKENNHEIKDYFIFEE